MAFQIKAAKLPEPVREYRFHETRRWRFDFAWPDAMIAVEIEGGTWINGAHNRGNHFESDCEKYNEANLAGWTVYRVTGAQINSGKCLDWLDKALNRVQV